MFFLLRFRLSCEIHPWWFEMTDVLTEYIWEWQVCWVWHILNFIIFSYIFETWIMILTSEILLCQIGSLELEGSADFHCNTGGTGATYSSPPQPLVGVALGLSPKRATVSEQLSMSNWLLVVPLSHWLALQQAPSPSPFSVEKEPRECGLRENVFLRLGCHLLRLLAFWLKSSFLAPTTHLPIYWPVTWQAEQAWAR